MSLPLPVVSRAVGAIFRLALSPRLPTAVHRRVLEVLAAGLPLPDGTVTRADRLGGVPVEYVTVGATVRPTTVLYLHGGAYVAGSPRTHRALTATLAQDSDTRVVAVDYRLAPEHPYPAAIEDALAVVDALVAEGRDLSSIAVVGDSAGGGLAAAVTAALVDRGLVPACLVLISPWTDPADRDFPADRDLLLDRRWLERSAADYLGAGDPADPGYAPAHRVPTGFPPTLVHVGTAEILRPQVLRYVEALRRAGVPTTLTDYPDLWHVAHLQATITEPAREAVRQIGAFVRAHVTPA
ncbi:alpha/beta hydrolase [Rhodococcoides corynebacterioides]|uniref:Alpha/beta hydrolase n=1 Tax=Rhodococcoides corynebacterioides TaxID=53972 RepID=A0ABS7NZY6_9NOCA|nr:alpha/beta hydrolase [Rhodococcus corynebacterioides]MBY6406424.1 alpha/beta hydrolase [Rhodococcus corynebacterioides]